MEKLRPDLADMSDIDLMELFCSKSFDDADIDRIANAMGERGMDFLNHSQRTPRAVHDRTASDRTAQD